jgi:hypothetical protein
MKTTPRERIWDAYQEEGSVRRLGLLPAANPDIQKAIIPPGGDDIARSITWNKTEVCLVNARGDLHDRVEAQIAMGLRATPVMDMALRTIWALSKKPENLDLIGDIARAAIVYVEMDAPRVPDPKDEGDSAGDGEPRCTAPGGHEFVCTGTAYGGDDESYHGEGRSYCVHCGADGDG